MGRAGSEIELAPVLVARDLVKRFGGVAAVDGVSINLRPGCIFADRAQWCGKTILFDLLAGEQRPTSGAIAVNGVAVEQAPAHARMKHRLGRTFQIPRPFAGMTWSRT